MKKIICLVMATLLFSSVISILGISYASDKPAKRACKVLSSKGLKAFVGDPVYCKITKEDLERARAEFKARKIARIEAIAVK